MAIINFNSISGVSTISVASSITVGNNVAIGTDRVTATTFSGNLSGNVTGNVTGTVNSTSGVTTVTQLNVGAGGTVITTTTGGSIGIGTTNPGGKIHIRTSAGSDTAGGSDSHIIFDLADDAGPAWAQRLYKGSAAGGGVLDGSFALDKRTGAVWTNVLTARRDNSSVGIGTTNPSTALHVSGKVLAVTSGTPSGTYNYAYNAHTNSGTTGLQITSGSNYVYFLGDGSNIILASDQGSTGQKVIVSRSSPDSSLTVDSSGRVTSPYQPMCYVVYTGTAIVRGTRIPLVTTNGTYPGTNQGNHWSNSTNIFTCPVAGVYHASLNITGNTTQSVQCQPTIRKNSGIVAYSYYPGGGVSISILCAANDTIEFLYNHDNAGYNGAEAAWASVYLLG